MMKTDKIIAIIDKCFTEHISVEQNDDEDAIFIVGRNDFLHAIWKELKKEEPTNFDNLISNQIIWIDVSCDITKEWWKKVGRINTVPRFELFCDKNIKIWLRDLLTTEEFLIKEGTINAGFKKANELI